MAQLVRAPPCHGGGRRFESDLGRFGAELSVPFHFKNICPSGGIGRRLGLKIPCRVIDVPVRPRPGAPKTLYMLVMYSVFFGQV